MHYPPNIDPKKETAKITAFIKKTFKNAGKTEAVIAASGGVDSSTALILTARAIGPTHLHVLYLPARATDPIHLELLRLLLKTANIPESNLSVIPVTAIIQKTWRIINRYSLSNNESGGQHIFAGSFGQAESLASQSSKKKVPKTNHSDQKNIVARNEERSSSSEFRLPGRYLEKGTDNRRKINQQIASLNRLRLANIAARARMIVIYDQAKLHDALVIGTENHSEYLLGYYTRFGDEASDLEPVKHLYKTQLLQLAEYLKIPSEIIAKPPTAGLWTGQTDEAELGFSYGDADPILYLRYEQKMSPNQIAKLVADQTQKKTEDIVPLVKKILDWTETMGFKHNLPHAL